MSNFRSDSSQEDIGEFQILVATNEDEKTILANYNNKMKEAFNAVTTNYMDCRNDDDPHKAIIKELQRKLKKQEERIEDLESENEALLKEIKRCEDYISNQVEEMKKLSYYIDFLGPGAQTQDENSRNEDTNFQRPPGLNPYEAKLAREQENNKVLVELIQNEKRSRQNTEETLSQTLRMCEDLMYKNQVLRHQNDVCATQCRELSVLMTKAQKVDELEGERKGLVSKIRECVCHMNNQDATINSLTYDMENKTNEHTRREEELNTVIEEMKTQIADNEQKLTDNKKRLDTIALENLCMNAHIDELERQASVYECEMSLKDENNKVLLCTLEQQKAENIKLRSALAQMTKIQDGLSEMLAQARRTIKSITQKLEAFDIERLESQRDTQIKISELEVKLVVANVTIKKLRGNLDQMKGVMDKNSTLRTLSAQLHETANCQVTQLQNANEDLSKKSQNLAEMYNYLKNVLYEKDKTFDDLRNQLVGLKEQLDNEQKLRASTEMILQDMTAAGDSEVTNLKKLICSLKQEISGLNAETEYLKKTTPVGKLKTRVMKLEQDNVRLRNEAKHSADYLKAILPGYVDPEELAKLKKQVTDLNEEVNKQKREVEDQKKLRFEDLQHAKSKLAQLEERNKRLEELVKEKAGLKSAKCKQTVVVLEKETKGDGETKYHCLYGVEGKTKKEDLKRKGERKKDEKKEDAKDEQSKDVDSREEDSLKEDPKFSSRIFSGPKKEDLKKKDEPRSPFQILDSEKEDPKSSSRVFFDQRKVDPKSSSRDLLDAKKKDPKSSSRILDQKKEDPKSSSRVFFDQRKEDPKSSSRIVDQKKEDPKSSSRVFLDAKKEDPKSSSRILDQKKEDPKSLSRVLEPGKEDPKSSSRVFSDQKTEDPKKADSTPFTQKRKRDKESSDSDQVQASKILKNLEETLRNETDPTKIKVLKQQLERIEESMEDPAVFQTVQKEIAERPLTTRQPIEDISEAKRMRRSSDNSGTSSDIQRQEDGFKSDPDERIKLLNEIDGHKNEIAELLYKINHSPAPELNNEELENLKAENEKLKNMLNDAAEQIKTSQSFLLRENTKNGNKLLEPLKEALEMEQKRVSELQEFWNNCEQKSDALGRKVAQLSKENAKLRTVSRDLKERTRGAAPSQVYMESIEGVNRNFVHWQGSVNNLIETVTDGIKTLAANVDEDPDARLQEALQKIEELKRTLDEIKNEKVATITKSVQETHLQELERRVSELQAENLVLHNEQDQLTEAVMHLKAKSVVKDPESDDESGVVNELESKLRQCERKNSNLQAELDRIRFQRLSMLNLASQDNIDDEKMLKLEEAVKQLKEENERLKKNAKEKTPIRSGTPGEKVSPESEEISQKKIQELEKRLEEWQESYDKDIGKLKAKIQVFQDLPPGLEACAEHVAELESKLQDYQTKNAVLEKNNALLEAENQQFNQLAQYDDRALSAESIEDKKIRDLVEHLRALGRRNESLQTRIIQLELDNGRLRNDLERIMGKEHKAFEKEMNRLRDLEKQTARCQEKYQNLRKRSMKIEIENRNLKKEYISTLIEKEKLILQGREQTKRLRETNKLLMKTQDKKESLTGRLVKLQVENQNLKQQLDSVISNEVEKHIEKLKDTDEELQEQNNILQTENDELRVIIKKLGEHKDNLENALPPGVLQFLAQPRADQLKHKIVQLEMENKNLKTQLEGLKSREVASLEGDLVDRRVAERLTDIREIDDEHMFRLKTVELEIENEFLKGELESRDRVGSDVGAKEKHIGELEDEIHKLTDTNENLKTVTVELELDNEYLKKELDRLSKEEASRNETSADRQLEKQNHALKMKIENLEGENKKLKHDLEVAGQAQISLEAHSEQKVIAEIEKLLQEYQNMKQTAILPSKVSDTSDIDDIEKRLQLWKKEYEPQVMELKRDLEALLGRESNYISRLENQLDKCRSRVVELEQENKNLRVALEVLLKEKDIIRNVKLVKEVEAELSRYRDTESLRRLSEADEEKIKDLQERLKDCQNTNRLLKQEKVALDRHLQDDKIRELEDRIQLLQKSKTEISKSRDKQPKVESTADLNKSVVFNDELAELRKSKEVLARDLDQLRSDKSLVENSLRQQLKADQHEKEEMTQEMERLRKLNSIHQKVKSDLEKQLEELTKSSSPLALRRVSSEKKGGSEQQLADYEKENESLKDEYLKLHEEFEEKVKRIHELEEQLKKCQEMNRRLKRKLKGENESSHSLDPEKDNDKNGDNSPPTSFGPDEEPKDVQKDDNSQTKGGQSEDAEAPQHDFEKPHQDNLTLQTDLTKIKELEAQLKEALAQSKRTKMQLEKLQKEKSVIHIKKADRRIIELEGQLIETRTENEINKTKVDYLRKQMASHDAIEKENKHLKTEINRLTLKIQSYDEDNKKLKNQVNELTQERHELVRRNDKQKMEIDELQKQVQLLGGGEYKAKNELKKRNAENEQLKLEISGLQTQIANLEKVVLENQDKSSEKRIRKLEETLWKYQDNNEYLKVKVDQLENEKSGLMMDVTVYLEEENKTFGAGPPQAKKLETILGKYRDTELNWMERAKQAGVQKQRVEHLEDKVQQCQVENERLKLVTIQLEAEINCLKRDMSSVRSELPIRTQKTSRPCEERASEAPENELAKQKRKWKTIVSKLTQQYEENIHLLKRRVQPPTPTLVSENPWMVGSTQPTLLPTAYTAMPFMWQPMLPYITPPQTFDENPEDSLEQLSDMVDKIQNTLNKSKRVLESELKTAISGNERCPEEEIEEQEQATLHYETGTSTAELIPQYADINENIIELHKQFLKQQETEAKIERLHTDIQETIRSLKQVAQTHKNERPLFVTNDEMPSTSTVTENAHECSNTIRIPHFHFVPRTQSSEIRKCSHTRFGDKHEETGE